MHVDSLVPHTCRHEQGLWAREGHRPRFTLCAWVKSELISRYEIHKTARAQRP